MFTPRNFSTSAALAAAVALALTPGAAFAKNGSDDGAGDDHGGSGGKSDRQEVRVAGKCGSGATSKLKLKNDDGAIEVEFEVDQNRSGPAWKVTIVRERKVVVRPSATTSGRSGSFSVERKISDLDGADLVTARGVGPKGLTCEATATLPA